MVGQTSLWNIRFHVSVGLRWISSRNISRKPAKLDPVEGRFFSMDCKKLRWPSIPKEKSNILHQFPLYQCSIINMSSIIKIGITWGWTLTTTYHYPIFSYQSHVLCLWVRDGQSSSTLLFTPKTTGRVGMFWGRKLWVSLKSWVPENPS